MKKCEKAKCKTYFWWNSLIFEVGFFAKKILMKIKKHSEKSLAKIGPCEN